MCNINLLYMYNIIIVSLWLIPLMYHYNNIMAYKTHVHSETQNEN